MAVERGPGALGLGTATALPGYGVGDGSGDPAALSDVIRAALGAGVRYVDTAAAYGAGESLLGELAGLLTRTAVRVCTKVSRSELHAGLEPSLGRLRFHAVDTVLLHSARGHDVVDGGVARALSSMKASWRTARTGASTYGVEDARTALAQPWCDTLQVEHSVLNPSVVAAVRRAKRPGQELVVRSALCKGLLTARRRALPEAFGDVVALVDELDGVASGWGFTLPELAIRYALDTPCVDVVLVGMASAPELELALAALRRPPLAPWQMDELARFDRSDDDLVHPERWETADRLAR